jgi:HSP20 family molecular chaperone IbpA
MSVPAHRATQSSPAGVNGALPDGGAPKDGAPSVCASDCKDLMGGLAGLAPKADAQSAGFVLKGGVPTAGLAGAQQQRKGDAEGAQPLKVAAPTAGLPGAPKGQGQQHGLLPRGEQGSTPKGGDPADRNDAAFSPYALSPYEFGALLDPFAAQIENAMQEQLLAAQMQQMLLGRNRGGGRSQPTLLVDVIETDPAIIIRVDCAGAKKEDIDITHDQHHIFITVCRPEPAREQGKLWVAHRLERPSGTSSRTIKVGGK